MPTLIAHANRTNLDGWGVVFYEKNDAYVFREPRARSNFEIRIPLRESLKVNRMEKGHAVCPWNDNWRKDLIQAYDLANEREKADALRKPVNEADVESGGTDQSNDIETQDLLAAGAS